MKTFIPKAADIDRKWYVVDADGMVLGRLASQVANILRGKNKPIYTPNMDTGDYVIIIKPARSWIRKSTIITADMPAASKRPSTAS